MGTPAKDLDITGSPKEKFRLSQLGGDGAQRQNRFKTPLLGKKIKLDAESKRKQRNPSALYGTDRVHEGLQAGFCEMPGENGAGTLWALWPMLRNVDFSSLTFKAPEVFRMGVHLFRILFHFG